MDPSPVTWMRHLRPDADVDATACGEELLVECRQTFGEHSEGVVAWAVGCTRSSIERAFEEFTGQPPTSEALLAVRREPEMAVIRCLLYVATHDVRYLGASNEIRSVIRHYVHHPLPEGMLIQGVHLYHRMVVSELLRAVDAILTAPDEKGRAMRELSDRAFHYWNVLATEVSEAYGEARREWSRSRDAEREAWVKSVFLGSADIDVATQKLGYRFRLTHTGIVVWSPRMAIDSAALADLTAKLLRAAGAIDILVLPDGHGRVVAWAAANGPLALEDIDRELPPTICLAFGTPGRGVDGFRTTHREAQAAMHISSLARASVGGSGATGYGDVELAYLLACDARLAHTFVRRELGPLCDSDDRTTALRQTLAQYLACDGSVARAARALHVARNTVGNRMNRIKELLGAERLAERRLEIECALRVMDAVGVLDPEKAAEPSEFSAERHPSQHGTDGRFDVARSPTAVMR
ncbi:PucR family transcriptional regulator [Nocardioides albidus]|uniref:PucR family transcriptional regulator n=1 Tax=Nocardioides albidus TaxID=1517589 RepID=UPI0011195E76|nr:PucR family transcriptional regulator [Nocardioides albidus]